MKTYEDVANSVGLKNITAKLFVEYMTRRWPNRFDPSYATEWAERFKSGQEWERSDLEGRKVLLSLCPDIYTAYMD